MFFFLREFEQNFKENELKKGLQYFQNNKVSELNTLHKSEHHYLVAKKEVVLKLKNQRLLSYTCSCGLKQNCAHLGAALFYLQKDLIGISASVDLGSKGLKKRTTNKSNNTPNRKIQSEKKYLNQFLEAQTKAIYFKDLDPMMDQLKTIPKIEVYELLVNYYFSGELNEECIDAQRLFVLITKIEKFRSRNTKDKPKDEFYINLALYGLFFDLMQKRFTSDETLLLSSLTSVKQKLNSFFHEGLNSEYNESWFYLAKRSLSSNKVIVSGLFYFLLTRFISRSKKKEHLDYLRTILLKRKIKSTYTARIQKMHVIKALLDIKTFGLKERVTFDISLTESIIAESEYYFNTNHPEKAFTVLESKYAQLQKLEPQFLLDYLNYIVKKASVFNKNEFRIKYLREIFKYDLFILPEKLTDYISLFQKSEQRKQLMQLYDFLKMNPFNYSFEKVSVVLWKAQEWDELIKEIKKQKNKFSLLHDVLIKKLPDFNLSDLEILKHHLVTALLENEFFPYQLKLISKTKAILKQLSNDIECNFMLEVMNRLLKQSQIYKFLKTEYKLTDN